MSRLRLRKRFLARGESLVATLGLSGSLILLAVVGVSWFDAEAYLRFQITQRFDVMGGYRYIQTDVEGQAGDRDFEADIYVQGLFATAGVTF